MALERRKYCRVTSYDDIKGCLTADVISVSGIDFIEPARNSFPGVIIFTGDYELGAEALLLGADYIWGKECSFNELRVNKLIELNKISRRYRAALGAIPGVTLHVSADYEVLDVYKSDMFVPIVDLSNAVGKKLDQIIPTNIANIFKKEIDRALNVNVPVCLSYDYEGVYRECKVVPINHGMDECLLMITDSTNFVELKANLSDAEALIDTIAQVEKLNGVVLAALKKSKNNEEM